MNPELITQNPKIKPPDIDEELPILSLIKKFTKVIACTVLVTFIYTGIVHQALYGAITMAQENSQEKVEKLNGTIDKFIMPYKYGRIIDGFKGTGDKLVVYVQDLHCNPEVQNNISEIIRVLDTRYGVNKVLVEGAPSGKIDTSVFSAIPDDKVRNRTAQILLEKGILTGTEYYQVINGKNNLYGVEDWDIYNQNLKRAQKNTCQ